MEVGGAYVRIRPSLSPDDRRVLEEISKTAHGLAEAVDTLLSRFAVEPETKELSE